MACEMVFCMKQGDKSDDIWNVLLTLGVYDTIKKGEELQQTDKKIKRKNNQK